MSTTVEGRSTWSHFRETCEYHSRGEEYGVISERPMGTTTDWRGMVLTGGGLCQLLTDNLLRVITILYNFFTILHCASQEQCHVCLGSHLTKPCLPCVATNKTAAIDVNGRSNIVEEIPFLKIC